MNSIHSYWRGISAIFAICILLAFLVTLIQPKIYESSSSGLVIASGSENVGSALAADSLAKSKALSFMSLAETRTVAELVRNELALQIDPDELLLRISAVVPTNTSEIRVTAAATDPEEARTLADAWVSGLAKQIKNLEPSTGNAEAVSAVVLQPLGKAGLPTAPVSPNTKLMLVIGAVLGLIFGMAYALIRARLDRRVSSAEALERIGAAVVGTIPKDNRLTEKRSILDGDAKGQASRENYAFTEALRELRTNLSYIDVDTPPRIIVVTSSIPGEGKSSVAANLAVAIASTNRHVVLIDADLRRPVQDKLFNLVAGAGLTDVLSHNADLEDVLQPYGPFPYLQVIGAGRIPPNPSELLGSKSMRSLLTELSSEAIVLIDAPPLLPVTDAAILGNSADGVLVVVKAGNTTSEEVTKALSNLRRVNARILGAILNQVPTKGPGASQYGYYGKYYYAASEEVGTDMEPTSSSAPDHDDSANGLNLSGPRRLQRLR